MPAFYDPVSVYFRCFMRSPRSNMTADIINRRYLDVLYAAPGFSESFAELRTKPASYTFRQQALSVIYRRQLRAHASPARSCDFLSFSFLCFKSMKVTTTSSRASSKSPTRVESAGEVFAHD